MYVSFEKAKGVSTKARRTEHATIFAALNWLAVTANLLSKSGRPTSIITSQKYYVTMQIMKF